ncbi:hypothetical protein [Streptococcus sp. S784/96/1]|uniref:hypothetical protein n=2 Tax=Streptococcus sp. S784/96/1 TaxID=2653499 RepID=UPI0013873A6F|nr:hypothetical protein [Streptococcus sp. S784/96/1]
MKFFGKMVANKLATVVVLLVILVGLGCFFTWKTNKFNGTVNAQYNFVLKKFTKENQLLVAGAEWETTRNQNFESEATKKWPKWTAFFKDLIISRDIEVKVPVKTEFKLDLTQLNQDDIELNDNVLTFKSPLTVNVDSQQDGTPDIVSTSSGIVDKAVDLLTASKKAMDFLEEKAQETVYETSQEAIRDRERQEKVAKYAAENLEKLLNLDNQNQEDIDVQISVSDLTFKNIDPKK